MSPFLRVQGMTHGEQSDKVVVLRPSRILSLLMVIVCPICVRGLFEIRHEAGAVAAWLGMVVFGLAAIVGAVRLIPGASYLRLDRQGFTFCAMFHRQTIAWVDVSEFGVTPRDAFRAYSIVGFNYVAGYDKNRAVRELAKATSGWEGALPGTYGMRPAELAVVMNEWRRRYGSQ